MFTQGPKKLIFSSGKLWITWQFHFTDVLELLRCRLSEATNVRREQTITESRVYGETYTKSSFKHSMPSTKMYDLDASASILFYRYHLLQRRAALDDIAKFPFVCNIDVVRLKASISEYLLELLLPFSKSLYLLVVGINHWMTLIKETAY